jgi:hypothetical protein
MSSQAVATSIKRNALLVGASGIILAISALPGLSALATLFIDIAFWPIDGKQSVSIPETRLLIAIAGGLTVGLCAFTWMVADRVLVRDPVNAKAIITTGVGSWFMVDSLGSIAAGAPFNAVINAAFLALLLWPLRGLATKPASQ